MFRGVVERWSERDRLLDRGAIRHHQLRPAPDCRLSYPGTVSLKNARRIRAIPRTMCGIHAT
jgi:hypothetical protein